MGVLGITIRTLSTINAQTAELTLNLINKQPLSAWKLTVLTHRQY